MYLSPCWLNYKATLGHQAAAQLLKGLFNHMMPVTPQPPKSASRMERLPMQLQHATLLTLFKNEYHTSSIKQHIFRLEVAMQKGPASRSLAAISTQPLEHLSTSRPQKEHTLKLGSLHAKGRLIANVLVSAMQHV